MDLLKKIDEMRQKRGWSYYTLALEAGLTQSTVLNMFSRGTQPSVKTLKAICNAFGISLAEFFEEDDKSQISREESELLAKYRRLSEKEKEAVSALIDKLGDLE